jgi:magnesium transporter
VPYFTKKYNLPGTSPGTLSSLRKMDASGVQIRLVDYARDHLQQKDGIKVYDCLPYLEKDTTTWLHVQGHPPEEVMRSLGEAFNLHALAMEDVINQGQRSKVDPFEDQLFVVLNLPSIGEDTVEVKQLSLFLSKNVLISFYEGDAALFQPILRRLQDPNSRHRSRGADYLFYSVVDIVIDQGFPLLESFGTRLEDLEEAILASDGKDTLEQIHVIKRELILLRRILWPQREAISQLLRDEHYLIEEGTRVFLRDCYDHTIQVMDLLETFREMSSSLMDVYLSSVSNRMNEVMRVLTVIATIFIPLTFLVGIYGMNFDPAVSPWSMPELSWRYGYVALWGIMLGIAGVMLYLFRRRGWL